MAYTVPLTVTTGSLATASQYNTYTKDNLIAIYAGAMSIASQATGDVIYASSASQLGRIAAVAAGSYLRSNGTSAAPIWSTLILPNAATANRLVYASATNTYGESASLTFDGTTFVVGSSKFNVTASNGNLSIPGGKISVDPANNTVALQVSSARTAAVLCLDAALETIITALDIKSTEASTGGTYITFTNSANAQAGSITHSGTTTVAYNTSSDERLKRKIGRASDLSGLRATEIYDFVWKESGVQSRGVFAQIAHKTTPWAITPPPRRKDKHGTDLDGTWMVDYSKFVPDLIVGWQDHDARLAALEKRP